MSDITEIFLQQSLNDEYALPKALAHFMFREIVEDIHSDNRITDAEMEQLNREACNRAGLFVSYIMNDPDMRLAFSTESVFAREWDPPVMTEELSAKLQIYKDIASEFKGK
ncbi:MAG: hypothetical protein IKF09_07960 [Clostridiales bacterium]|nr:hypothetical protein [Clostridiales bacterium]